MSRLLGAPKVGAVLVVVVNVVIILVVVGKEPIWLVGGLNGESVASGSSSNSDWLKGLPSLGGVGDNMLGSSSSM